MLNEKLIKMFLRKFRTYYSFDSAINDVQNYYLEEFFNTLTLNGLPLHKLVLKKNFSTCS